MINIRPFKRKNDPSKIDMAGASYEHDQTGDQIR